MTRMESSAEIVKKFFPNKQWESFVDIVKKRFINIYENYMKQKELGLEPRLPIFQVNEEECENSNSDSDKDEEWIPHSRKSRIKKLQRSLKSWPEFQPQKEDSDSDSEEDTLLSSSQDNIKHLWNSVTLEPDSHNNIKKKRPLNTSKNKGEVTASRKPRRFRPGTRALQEIRRYQNSTDLLIQRAPFRRLVKEIFLDLGAINYRVQVLALEALHEAAEAFLVSLMEEGNLCALHAKRVTLFRSDLALAGRNGGTFI